MDGRTAILFTRSGLGEAPAPLQGALAVTFTTLLASGEGVPGKLLFYGEGVRLACEGSPVLDQLAKLSARGADLVLCRTCLDYLGLLDKVAAGRVGGMPEILAALDGAEKVLSV